MADVTPVPQMRTGLIYALLDPRSNEPRYVGQTVQSAAERLYQHMRAARAGRKAYVCSWIKSLPTPPLMVILETVLEDQLDAAECRWIKTMRADGARLCNLTDGGGGVRGWRASPETLAKMSAAQTGRTHTAETRAKMSAIARRRGMPREVAEASIAARRGKPMQRGPEWLSNVRRAARQRKGGNNRLGTRHTPETRAKMSAAQVGRQFSAETRAKMSAAAKARAQTPEGRALLSSAARAGHGKRQKVAVADLVLF